MMNPIGSSVPAIAGFTEHQKDTPERIEDAARQFESLLIGQMMKSMRESDSAGWLGTGEEDKANDSAMEIAEQQFAQAMANSGGLGLARLISSGLKTKAEDSRKSDQLLQPTRP
ncbi:MAG: hypothetical protein U0Q18_09450 [Bryobacteraceae bacterium]